MKNIQQNDLEMLEYFIGYGLSASDEEKKMYANLILLVRDWIWQDEAEFGFKGGKKYLNNDLSKLCPYLNKCFQKVEFFLMPKPGEKIQTEKNHNRSSCDVETQFKEQILKFTSKIFKRENLAIKKLNGEAVTCRDLSLLMRNYLELLKSDEMPDVYTILEANMKSTNISLIEKLRDRYKQQMKETMEKGCLEINNLNRLHAAKMEEALKDFDSKLKIVNNETMIRDYKTKLEEEINEEFKHFKNKNKLKKK